MPARPGLRYLAPTEPSLTMSLGMTFSSPCRRSLMMSRRSRSVMALPVGRVLEIEEPEIRGGDPCPEPDRGEHHFHKKVCRRRGKIQPVGRQRVGLLGRPGRGIGLRYDLGGREERRSVWVVQCWFRFPCRLLFWFGESERLRFADVPDVLPRCSIMPQYDADARTILQAGGRV